MTVTFRLGMVMVFVLAMSSTALAVIEDFGGYPAGTVMAGMAIGGTISQGSGFPNFTLSVTNQGGGPHSLIIFDSANPTGEDPDLGTPHADFGGPGLGTGGALGQLGENNTALGNLLIIAEDVVDADHNGLVDDPDDEGGGGIVEFVFVRPQIIESITIVDIDETTPARFDMYNAGGLVGTAQSHSYGNNSVETVDLSSFGLVRRLVVTFDMSAGIAEIIFRSPDSTVEPTQWGKVKEAFF